MTPAEQTFLQRMVPHVMAGASIREAALLVKQRDEELWIMATERSERGEAIRGELCRYVYEKIRGMA